MNTFSQQTLYFLKTCFNSKDFLYFLFLKSFDQTNSRFFFSIEPMSFGLPSSLTIWALRFHSGRESEVEWTQQSTWMSASKSDFCLLSSVKHLRCSFFRIKIKDISSNFMLSQNIYSVNSKIRRRVLFENNTFSEKNALFESHYTTGFISEVLTKHVVFVKTKKKLYFIKHE